MILDSHDLVAAYTAAGIWGRKTLMDLVIDTAALTPDAGRWSIRPTAPSSCPASRDG